MPDISEAKVLILATDGFEASELFDPRQTLIDAGATVKLAAPAKQAIQGVVQDEKGESIDPDLLLDDVDTDDYHALLLPGGVANADKLRLEARAVEIVQEFMDAEKPVAAICHAPWLLIEADVVNGMRMTSWPSLRTDLINAGATFVDKEVAVDGNLITSRMPDDIPAFTAALIDAIEEEDEDVDADDDEEDEDS